METSSDDSFVWADAMSDESSEPSEQDAVIMNGKDDHRKIKEKFLESKHPNESFHDVKSRKRKKKNSQQSDKSDTEPTPKIKKNIKIEPESLLDLKVKDEARCDSHTVKNEVDEAFLNIEVKKENNTFVTLVKNPKKKRKKNNEIDSSETENENNQILVKQENHSNSRLPCTEDKSSTEETVIEVPSQSTYTENEKHASSIKQENPYSHHTLSHTNHTDNDTVIVDKFIKDETVVEKPKKKKIKKSKKKNDDEEQYSLEVNSINDSTQILQQCCSDDDIEVITNKERALNVKTTKQKSKSKSTVFENSDVGYGICNSNRKLLTSNMEKYLKTNTELKPDTSKIPKNCIITQDDEMWILTCPEDMNISSLKNIDLTIDKKCKVKVNGETFEGFNDEQSKQIAFLGYNNDKYFISYNMCNSIVKFQRKIPKPNPDDSQLQKTKNNCIPLPETKRRHPYFGIKYKNSIKIPSNIAERLHKCYYNTLFNKEVYENEKLSNAFIKKRKKHKHTKCKHSEDKNSIENLSSYILELEENRKNKKKHKHTEIEEVQHSVKKKKNSTELSKAWETEQDIEENLFNF